MVRAGVVEDCRGCIAAAAARSGTSRAPLLLAAIAGLALALGLLVYLTDRGASLAAWMPALPLATRGPLFGTAAQWLPSFVHPFAFSLLTAAMAPVAARPAYRACAAWWAVNVVFEIGQNPRFAGPIAEGLPLMAGPGWTTRRLSDYFLHGTFDAGDLLAATAGAAAAAGVLWLAHRRSTRHAR